MKQSTDQTIIRIHWRTAIIWLFFLGIFFFLSYGQVNQFTATRDVLGLAAGKGVGQIVFFWEHHIPFWSWSIIPYWSIDLLYGYSLFLKCTRENLQRHVYRLILASVIACIGFLVFPLKYSFQKPVVTGIFGTLFDWLALFDLPYNQAPSLHIILVWVLGYQFLMTIRDKYSSDEIGDSNRRKMQHKKGIFYECLLTGWFGLIGLSVLTTWQHHFIDVITGFFVGVMITYCLPNCNRQHRLNDEMAHTSQNEQIVMSPIINEINEYSARKGKSLAFRYAVLGCLCLSLALQGGIWWCFLWPATSCIILVCAYASRSVLVFQKDYTGNVSISARILLWPYHVVASMSRHYFCYRLKLDQHTKVAKHIILGGYPQQKINTHAVLDLTTEYSRNRHSQGLIYRNCPQLDLVAPSIKQLHDSVLILNQLTQCGTVYIHCALGLSRSVLVVAAWLLLNQHVANPEEAYRMIHQIRPALLLSETHLRVLIAWHSVMNKKTVNEAHTLC